MGTTTLHDPAATPAAGPVPAAGPGTPPVPGATRRQVLAGAGILAGAGLLAACSSTPERTPAGETTTSGATTDPATGGATTDGGQSAGSGATSIAALADIPVGGGLSATLDGQPILLTQPTAGSVVALSAICTHQGCTVMPDGGRLLCPCHGSVYGLDGSNTSGPAPSPLVPIVVHIEGDQVVPGAA